MNFLLLLLDEMLFAFLAALIIFLLFIFLKTNYSKKNLLKRISRKLGFEVLSSEGIILLGGSFQGREIRIEEISLSSGGGTLLTEFQMSTSSSFPGKILISRENILTKLVNIFGFNDFISGNDEFDSEYHIKIQDSSMARKILLPEIINEILLIDPDKIEIDTSQILFSFQKNLVKFSEAEVKEILSKMAVLAEQIEKLSF